MRYYDTDLYQRLDNIDETLTEIYKLFNQQLKEQQRCNRINQKNYNLNKSYTERQLHFIEKQEQLLDLNIEIAKEQLSLIRRDSNEEVIKG